MSVSVNVGGPREMGAVGFLNWDDGAPYRSQTMTTLPRCAVTFAVLQPCATGRHLGKLSLSLRVLDVIRVGLSRTRNC